MTLLVNSSSGYKDFFKCIRVCIKIFTLLIASNNDKFFAQPKPKQPLLQECALTEFQTAKISEPSLALDSSLDGPSTTALRPVDIVVS